MHIRDSLEHHNKRNAGYYYGKYGNNNRYYSPAPCYFFLIVWLIHTYISSAMLHPFVDGFITRNNRILTTAGIQIVSRIKKTQIFVICKSVEVMSVIIMTHVVS